MTNKTMSMLMVGWAVMSISAAMAHADGTGVAVPSNTAEVEIPVTVLLAPPVGYEDKNNIQVVLYGMLPNACYSIGNYRVEKLGSNELAVHQFAYKENQGLCADDSGIPESMKMAVPFMVEVSVGQLPAGDYKFDYQVVGGTIGTRMLNVAKATAPTVDSLPYAAVSSASVPELVNGMKDVKVTLDGILNSTCTSLDSNVRVLHYKDVTVIEPLIKVKTGVICAQMIVPFQLPVNLGKMVPGRYLIHIRSMNGKSVNRVIDVSKL